MDQRITKLSDHIILCGGGRTGKHIAQELFQTKTPFVIIEHDETKLHSIPDIENMPHLVGDATLDETLRLAGIERAQGLVATLGDDKDNVYIVLSARSLNPALRIVSRLIEEENAGKLLRAGADEIVSPNAIGGLRMASVLLRPTVVSFLDEMLRAPGEILRVEEVAVNDLPALVGQTLAEAHIGQRTGLLVLAITHPNQQGHHFNPPAGTHLQAGDVLIVMGTPQQRKTLLDLGRH